LEFIRLFIPNSPVWPVSGGINPEGDEPQRGLRSIEEHHNRHPTKKEIGSILQHERKNEHVPDGTQSQNPQKDSA
jgi:hypothetical protein